MPALGSCVFRVGFWALYCYLLTVPLVFLLLLLVCLCVSSPACHTTEMMYFKYLADMEPSEVCMMIGTCLGDVLNKMQVRGCCAHVVCL